MKYKALDPVVLERDLPAHGLCTGDLGAVVEVYEPDGLEVEFVTASGKTQAVVTLTVADVRPAPLPVVCTSAKTWATLNG